MLLYGLFLRSFWVKIERIGGRCPVCDIQPALFSFCCFIILIISVLWLINLSLLLIFIFAILFFNFL